MATPVRINDNLYAKLQTLAENEKRSITKQLELMLEKLLNS